MAKLTEILDSEKQRTTPESYREVKLWPDGSFFRAYEWSAWLCVRYIRQFKVTRRNIKSVNTDMLFVGFPKTSLDKFKPDGSEVIVREGKDEICLLLPESLVKADEGSSLEEQFSNWRTTIPLTEDKPAANKDGTVRQQGVSSSAQPMSMTGIMKRILEFPIENNCPIECMLFLTELKKQASSLL